MHIDIIYPIELREYLIKEVKVFISVKRTRDEVNDYIEILLNKYLDDEDRFNIFMKENQINIESLSGFKQKIIKELEFFEIESHNEDFKDFILEELMTCEDKKVILSGAGISTSAGINDYKDGLFKYIEENEIGERPQDVICYDFIKKHPIIYYHLNKKFAMSNDTKPTNSHKFIKHFDENKTLHRYYTQNIDNIDSKLELGDKLVQAHGVVGSTICLSCNKKYDASLDLTCFKDITYEEAVLYDEYYNKGDERYLDAFNDESKLKCQCNSFIYHDYVYYGCDLTDKFYKELGNIYDLKFNEIRMMIVMGTRLLVRPFNLIYERIIEMNPASIVVGFDLEKCVSCDVFFKGDVDFITLWLLNVIFV